MSRPDHETDEMHKFMAGTLAEQRASLKQWGLPDAGLLILVSGCHGNCFFCAHDNVRKPPRQSLTSWDRVDRFLRANDDAELLCLGGNEPSSHPYFERTLALARASGFTRIQLMTSGYTLLENAVKWHDLGVSSVCVPLYGDGACHDDIVRISGHHEQVVAGLDAARSAGIDIHIHNVAMRRTLAGLGALAKMCLQRWQTQLRIAPLRPKDALFVFTDEASTDAELTAALAGVPASLLGYPPCTMPARDREGPLLTRLYFRTQARRQLPVCNDCVLRGECPGLVPGGAPHPFSSR